MILDKNAKFFDGTPAAAVSGKRFAQRLKHRADRIGRKLSALIKPRQQQIDWLDWLLIGVPKAGTTSLYQALRQHPEIVMPIGKETQFFCSEHYYRGLSWYRHEHFPDLDTSMSVGELSPKYLIHRTVPPRLKASIRSDLKFIVILRNPVERAYSHYCHSHRVFKTVPYRPTEPLSFAQALLAEPQRLAEPDEDSFTHHSWNAYFYTGLYALHLEHWFSVFRRDRFLVLILEEMSRDPRPALSAVLQHIGVEDISDRMELPWVNSATDSRIDPELRDRLYEAYRPWNRQLERLLGRDLGIWEPADPAAADPCQEVPRP